MEHKEFEQQYIRSLDETLTTIEWHQLRFAISSDPQCAHIAAKHDRVREIVKRKSSSSFGPDFASSVMKAIQKGISSFDAEIAFIFKKIHLLAAGVIICFLIVNVIFADDLSIQSILALDNFNTPAATPSNDEIIIDLSELINNNQ